jgi:hypothetical protein
VGRDEVSLRLPGLPERRTEDERARLIVAGVPAERLRVSLVDSGNAKVICVLMAVSERGGAKLEPNQPCDGTAPAKTLVRSGRLRFYGARAELSFEALVEAEHGEVLADGVLSYRFSGERR